MIIAFYASDLYHLYLFVMSVNTQQTHTQNMQCHMRLASKCKMAFYVCWVIAVLLNCDTPDGRPTDKSTNSNAGRDYLHTKCRDKEKRKCGSPTTATTITNRFARKRRKNIDIRLYCNFARYSSVIRLICNFQFSWKNPSDRQLHCCRKKRHNFAIKFIYGHCTKHGNQRHSISHHLF